MMTTKTVSCLMVSFVPLNRAAIEVDQHLARSRQSIRCYIDQDYPHKELIIVCSGPRGYIRAVQRLIRTSRRGDIKLIVVDVPAPLSNLRNVALQNATGDYVCPWDDDDLNHPRRLSSQLSAMIAVDASSCFLLDYLHWFADTNDLYWSDWYHHPSQLGLPGTLLAVRDNFPEYENGLSRDEDSLIQAQLYLNTSRMALIRDLGYLYIYRYHGDNSFSRDHHLHCAKRFAVSESRVRAFIPSIAASIKMHTREPITVRDKSDAIVTLVSPQSPTCISRDDRLLRKEDARVITIQRSMDTVNTLCSAADLVNRGMAATMTVQL